MCVCAVTANCTLFAKCDFTFEEEEGFRPSNSDSADTEWFESGVVKVESGGIATTTASTNSGRRLVQSTSNGSRATFKHFIVRLNCLRDPNPNRKLDGVAAACFRSNVQRQDKCDEIQKENDGSLEDCRAACLAKQACTG